LLSKMLRWRCCAPAWRSVVTKAGLIQAWFRTAPPCPLQIQL
jgi:hypothetical protein